MELRKLLTIDDLVQFCTNNPIEKFEASQAGYQICVQVPATFEIESNDDTMFYGTCKLMHSGRNRNASNVTSEALEKLLPTIKYKPLLADFCEINGVRDFTNHAMKILDNNTIEYIERQIGCFTADEPYIQYDEDLQKDFLYARVAIPKEYTDAADIIERKGGTKVSAELIINKFSWNAKDNILDLEDVTLQGATCLGTNPITGKEIQEGMESANISIQDFSIEQNSGISAFATTNTLQNENKIIAMLEKLQNSISNLANLNIEQNLEKGGSQVNKFEQLLEKYNKTVDDINFDYENMSDEELEVKFAELFDNEGTNNDTDNFNEGTATSTDDASSDDYLNEPDDNADNSETTFAAPVQYSITMSDGFTRCFEISLNDKICALANLVNAVYSEADNTWYQVEVYNSNVVMIDYWNDIAYKQSYSEDGENYTLTGDRVRVYSEWLTSDEQETLNNMRANYASMSEKLQKYQLAEEKVKKENLMASKDYASIADKADFIEIATSVTNGTDNFSYDELKKKVDNMLLSYAKSGSLTFASNSEDKFKRTSKKYFSIDPNKKSTKPNSRYGSLKFD